jgi:DNA-binding NarL/FixJ family response regulator
MASCILELYRCVLSAQEQAMKNSDSRIRILAVDDHPLLREGIAAMIEGQPDMLLVGEASNGLAAIEQFSALRPDVTLMDLQMPEMGGVEAIVAIRNMSSHAKIIVLTTYKGDAQALRAIKAGAVSYLLKSALRKEMLETIRSAHAGKRHIPPEIACEIAEHAADDALSSREMEVLRLVARGNANKQIGSLLSISEETVKMHMKNVLSKLDANDRTHAVTIALKRGVIEL